MSCYEDTFVNAVGIGSETNTPINSIHKAIIQARNFSHSSQA